MTNFEKSSTKNPKDYGIRAVLDRAKQELTRPFGTEVIFPEDLPDSQELISVKKIESDQK